MPPRTEELPPLREGAQCALELPGAAAPLDATVAGFDARAAFLLVPALDAAARGALEAAEAAGFLLLSDGGGPLRALRVSIVPSERPGTLAVSLLDAFRLGQRRGAARARLRFRAALEGSGAPIAATTLDVSETGCRVALGSPWPRSEAVVRIALGQAEIVLDARLVRQRPGEASFRFVDPGAQERATLAALVLAFHGTAPAGAARGDAA